MANKAAKSLACLFLRVGLFCGCAVHAHDVGVMGGRPLDWSTSQISRVMGSGDLDDPNAAVISIDGKRCLYGNRFDINVRDSFAFDIDEAVEVEVEFYSPMDFKEVELSYDSSDKVPLSPLYMTSGPFDNQIQFSSFDSRPWQSKRLILPRARFANRGLSGSDFSIYSVDGGMSGSHKITICGLQLKRSYATPVPEGYGRVMVEVLNELGNVTPARAGIYAKDGRDPLPSDEAIALRHYDEMVRVVALRPGTGVWPAQNQTVFYINGRYQARLPVGEYELILAKGPEYRMARRSFTISADKTSNLGVKMVRWENMPAKKWYSGDSHIHYARASKHDDGSVLAFAEAEDLHVANLLQMGNRANVYFRQYGWTKVGGGAENLYLLAPGQEDPRTAYRGHTVHLNLKEPVRDPGHYLQYQSIFEQTRAQGAVVGYAHASDNLDVPLADGFGHRRGMLLDVPFGLVDFIEVLQAGGVSTRTWFDFLNLGYKLTPAAGTDYPYVDVPGIVRTYARIEGEFTPQSWFDGFKNGHVFVTDGPMLEFEANGQGMGSELQMRSGSTLEIRGRARINPDFGRMERLILIEQGEIVKTVSVADGAEMLVLDFKTTVKKGTWFVLRAEGGKQEKGTAGVALSAPIYVDVDGKGFWKPAAVRGIVTGLKRDMQSILEPSDVDMEGWATGELNRRHWPSEKPLLKQRIDQVKVIYDDLLKRAEQALAEEKEQPLAAQRTEGTTPPMAK